MLRHFIVLTFLFVTLNLQCMEQKPGNVEKDRIEEVQEKDDTVKLFSDESFDETNNALVAAPQAPQKKRFFVHIISPAKAAAIGSAPQKNEPLALKIICTRAINSLLRTNSLTLSNWVKYMSCLPEELQYTLCDDLIVRNPLENSADGLGKNKRLELCAQICSELKIINQENCYTLFLDTMLKNLSKFINRSFNLDCIEKILAQKKGLGEELLKRLTDINGFHLFAYELDNKTHYLISNKKIDDFSVKQSELTLLVNDAISVTSVVVKQEMNKNIRPGIMSARKILKF